MTFSSDRSEDTLVDTIWHFPSFDRVTTIYAPSAIQDTDNAHLTTLLFVSYISPWRIWPFFPKPRLFMVIIIIQQTLLSTRRGSMACEIPRRDRQTQQILSADSASLVCTSFP